MELKKTKNYHLINICYILEDKILKYKRLDFLFDIEDRISLDDFAKNTGYLKEDVFKIFSLNQDILKDFELTGEYLVRKTKDLALQFIEKLDQQFNQWELNKDANDVKKN